MSKMKLKFNPNLKYQEDAVKSVTDLFEGQRVLFGNFSITGQTTLDSTRGVSNKRDISKSDMLDNLRKVQKLHKLGLSSKLQDLDFNIEMETGTGKTYVYIKTILELNKLYGFTKFIIVVPNVAIREGVYKTLEITKEHFKELYDNVIYDYFAYDSSKLEQVRNFAVNSNIEIMIINIAAFNKGFEDITKTTGAAGKANIIHRENDRLSGYKPIDLIAETNPIVIIDEPQSSVSTDLGKKAIESLNPLCTLRYSATHKEIQNLIYKLDAVDAYEKHLVKQIEVASIQSQDFHNDAYMKLLSTNNKKSPITAKLEVNVNKNGKSTRKEVNVRKGDDLLDITGFDKYQGFIIDEIYCEEGEEYVTFSPKDVMLKKDIAQGDLPDIEIKRAQIRKTIDEHLSKMLDLNKKGIKVLSLFFIDKVANYRQYDEEGNPVKGPYAKIFEEQYNDLIKSTKYKHLNEGIPVEEVHNGYFSADKSGKNKGKFKDTKGNTKADDDTYSLIMKDKEKLLSFNSNLQFIFSHSALREGWDNPNVFQICTLNETSSTMKKRQEIGRGLRLCVNQEGERIKDQSDNILTIMANESYEEFAKSLQSEMEKDQGIKFGIIDKYIFSHIEMENKNGKLEPIEQQGSLEIFNYFKKMNYINGKGKVQEALKVAIYDDNVYVPERFESIKDEIIEVAKTRTRKLEVRDASKKRKVQVNKHVFLSDEFKEFWKKINRKTYYSVDYDSEELIKNCVNALNNDIDVRPPKLIYTKGGLAIGADGVNVDSKGRISTYDAEYEMELPDIVTFLQNETFLTRRTIVEILKRTVSLDQFKKNPQAYMEEALKVIKKELSKLIFDGIKYYQMDEVYKQELFQKDELYGYLGKNLVESDDKSVYNYILCDSKVEQEFAERLENDPDVKLYTKLPYWFKINTPIGGYNPDWAILIEEGGKENMYFVIETKGTVDSDNRRITENQKIKCGKKHFEALDTGVKFDAADSYQFFKVNVV